MSYEDYGQQYGSDSHGFYQSEFTIEGEQPQGNDQHGAQHQQQWVEPPQPDPNVAFRARSAQSQQPQWGVGQAQGYSYTPQTQVYAPAEGYSQQQQGSHSIPYHLVSEWELACSLCSVHFYCGYKQRVIIVSIVL